MSDSSTRDLYANINSDGWMITTIIFLMLIFVMGIVNAVFFIRIYNQSKDRDTGTGINGLTVTGSVVIGVVSIIISVIAFGWALYLIAKRYKIKDSVKSWYNTQLMKSEFIQKSREKMGKAFDTAFGFFKRNGDPDTIAKQKAYDLCKEGWSKPSEIELIPRRGMMSMPNMMDQ